MRQREAVRSGAEEGGEASRQGYSSPAPSLLPSRLQLLTEANRSCRKLSTRHSPLITRISHRELLGLEILQLAENKHRRTVLIANFEPNRFFNFRSDVSK
jgi:hypothetical protein